MNDDPESRARARIGAVLNDKWTLERLLGVGGMAAVYAARHRNGARAAIKVLHPELSRQKEVRERFLREGYAANRVEHEGAVKVLDDDVVAAGKEAGAAYLVMELLEGQSLQTRMGERPRVGEREFLAIAAAVLEVLEAAHARGVIHRDLKPENLFLLESRASDSKPRVKVLDFGLARIMDGQSNTAYGLALGTPSFMSPEQAAGKIDEIDGRTDLFSLATTGFRVRTGRKLHDAANPVELVTKMASLPAPPIASVCPDVSPAFAKVIDRALQFRREDRYESATAMRLDVERAVAELDGLAHTVPSLDAPPVRRSQRAPPARSSGRKDAKASLPVLPGHPARYRRRLGPWVLAVGGVFLGLAAYVGLWRTASAPGEQTADAAAPVMPRATAATLSSVESGAPYGPSSVTAHEPSLTQPPAVHRTVPALPLPSHSGVAPTHKRPH